MFCFSCAVSGRSAGKNFVTVNGGSFPNSSICIYSSHFTCLYQWIMYASNVPAYATYVLYTHLPHTNFSSRWGRGNGALCAFPPLLYTLTQIWHTPPLSRKWCLFLLILKYGSSLRLFYFSFHHFSYFYQFWSFLPLRKTTLDWNTDKG